MRTPLARIALCTLLAGCTNTRRKKHRCAAPTPQAHRHRRNPQAPRRTTTSTPSPGRRPRSSTTDLSRGLSRRRRKAASCAQGSEWDALPKRERKRPLSPKLKPAVIVDIDETVLDNSPYQARLDRRGKDSTNTAGRNGAARNARRPLPGALGFAQAAAKKGCDRVLPFEPRAGSERGDAAEPACRVGFPIDENETVFLGLGTVVEGCEQNGTRKVADANCRPHASRADAARRSDR